MMYLLILCLFSCLKVKGRAEERAEIIRKLLDKEIITEEQIADLLKISVKEVRKIAASVPVQV